MKKVLIYFLFVFSLLFFSRPVIAGAYRLELSNNQTGITCQKGDQNCQFETQAHIYNDINQPLYNTTLYTSSGGCNISYLFDGNWTSGSSKISTVYDPGALVTVVTVKVKPPDEIGTWTSTFYVDGQTCKTNLNSPDCYYYGASSFNVQFNVINAPTVIPPSPIPTVIIPTAIPTTPITPTKITTVTPTESITFSSPIPSLSPTPTIKIINSSLITAMPTSQPSSSSDNTINSFDSETKVVDVSTSTASLKNNDKSFGSVKLFKNNNKAAAKLNLTNGSKIKKTSEQSSLDFYTKIKQIITQFLQKFKIIS